MYIIVHQSIVRGKEAKDKIYDTKILNYIKLYILVIVYK